MSWRSKSTNFLAFAVVAMTTFTSPAMAADVRDCFRLSDTDSTIAGCTRAISEGVPGGAGPAFANRGIAWREKGEYDRSIADLNEAIRLQPKFRNAFNSRGITWTEMREYDRAIADYSQAIRLDPKYDEGYHNRGSAWDDKGEFDRAIADYNEAIRLRPRDSNHYNGRGNAWDNKGEYDLAIADYNEAIRLDPKYSRPYVNRGNVWREKGEFDRAILDCDAAIRLAPKFVNAYALRGEVWRLKGDLDRALADEDQAIALEPTGSLGYAVRGDTLRYMGEFRRAIADYEHALRNWPDYIPAFTGLGLTYEKMGDMASARAKFQQASRSQSSFRFSDYSKRTLETARARLAALDSGVAQPSIPNALSKPTSATSIPTPAVSIPTILPSAIETTVAKQGRRVALVIGNSAYTSVPALANPQKDAEAIAASLRNIGFESVTTVNNATREKLVESLSIFAKEAAKADWAMVYYAGHGLEVGGVNYLVPTDAKLAVDRDIQSEAVTLDQVRAAINTARKLKLVVLDACRVNPFSLRMTAAPEAAAAPSPTGGAIIASRGFRRGGLAEVNATGGTLVVFAAKYGQVALDGDGDHSPFAVAVLQRLATPGVEINMLFRLVRDDVMEATAGRQEPYTYGSLPGKEDFVFVEK